MGQKRCSAPVYPKQMPYSQAPWVACSLLNDSPRLVRRWLFYPAPHAFCKKEGYTHGSAERILDRMIAQLEKDPASLLDAFFSNVHAPQKPSRQSRPHPPTDLNALREGLLYLRDTDLRTLIPLITPTRSADAWNS